MALECKFRKGTVVRRPICEQLRRLLRPSTMVQFTSDPSGGQGTAMRDILGYLVEYSVFHRDSAGKSYIPMT